MFCGCQSPTCGQAESCPLCSLLCSQCPYTEAQSARADLTALPGSSQAPAHNRRSSVDRIPRPQASPGAGWASASQAAPGPFHSCGGQAPGPELHASSSNVPEQAGMDLCSESTGWIGSQWGTWPGGVGPLGCPWSGNQWWTEAQGDAMGWPLELPGALLGLGSMTHT